MPQPGAVAGQPPPVAESPAEALIFVGVCLLSLLTSVVALIWLCVCRASDRGRLAARELHLQEHQHQHHQPGRAFRLPSLPAGPSPTHVAVSHPDGEVALGTRTRPDKKMCATHQQTKAWEEALLSWRPSASQTFI